MANIGMIMAGSSGLGFTTIPTSLIVLGVAGVFELFGFVLLILGLVTGGKKEVIREKVVQVPLVEKEGETKKLREERTKKTILHRMWKRAKAD